MTTPVLKAMTPDLYTYIPHTLNHLETRQDARFYRKKPDKRKEASMTTMNLDSLNSCLHQIASRTMRPTDPVLILDTESGLFSIQSSQTDLDPQETLIADNLDIDGIPGWTDIPDPTGIYVSDPWELMKFIQMVLHEVAPGEANTQGQGQGEAIQFPFHNKRHPL